MHLGESTYMQGHVHSGFTTETGREHIYIYICNITPDNPRVTETPPPPPALSETNSA